MARRSCLLVTRAGRGSPSNRSNASMTCTMFARKPSSSAWVAHALNISDSARSREMVASPPPEAGLDAKKLKPLHTAATTSSAGLSSRLSEHAISLGSTLALLDRSKPSNRATKCGSMAQPSRPRKPVMITVKWDLLIVSRVPKTPIRSSRVRPCRTMRACRNRSSRHRRARSSSSGASGMDLSPTRRGSGSGSARNATALGGFAFLLGFAGPASAAVCPAVVSGAPLDAAAEAAALPDAPGLSRPAGDASTLASRARLAADSVPSPGRDPTRAAGGGLSPILAPTGSSGSL
mmetsp:Transcript_25593/g.96395  ORF Transcript_25593/g.96395 Transcript_25593/m.96395 type:complete len:292 (+) Transcript_25593:514-1389(+)